jgi:hypothetical protein
MSQADNQIYARNLLSKGYGYPMWFPEPFDNLPDVYKANGVRIGDVGIITVHGSFDFLFNICVSSDDPINCHGVPEGFEQVEYTPLEVSTHVRGHASGADFRSASITKKRLRLSGELEDNRCACALLLPYDLAHLTEGRFLPGWVRDSSTQVLLLKGLFWSSLMEQVAKILPTRGNSGFKHGGTLRPGIILPMVH